MRKDSVIIADEYLRIQIGDLLPGDVLLFYYGNKLTELHGRNRRAEFGTSTNPPYHAAMVVEVNTLTETVLILDPGATTALQYLSKYMCQSSKRIDVVRYAMTANQRLLCIEGVKELVSKTRIYDIKGYGAFISQMPFCGWFKFLVKPAENLFYCSDAVAYCIEEKAKFEISPYDHDFTAPVDIQLYALKHPEIATIRTLKQREV